MYAYITWTRTKTINSCVKSLHSVQRVAVVDGGDE